MGIAPDSVIDLKKTFISSKVGEETVIFDDERGAYVGLSEVGTAILDMLDEPKTVSSLVDELLKSYDVDHKTCETNVISFLKDMHVAKLITVG